MTGGDDPPPCDGKASCYIEFGEERIARVDIDFLSGSYADDTLAWHENVAGDGSVWQAHVLSTALNAPYSAITADLDGDGDPDVVAGSQINGAVVWIENLGTRVFASGFDSEPLGDPSASLGCWSTSVP